MELPAGFEPTVSELQSLALPLGYGSSDGIITLYYGRRNSQISCARIKERPLLRPLLYLLSFSLRAAAISLRRATR